MGYQNLMNTEKGTEEELKEDRDNEVLRAYLFFSFSLLDHINCKIFIRMSVR